MPPYKIFATKKQSWERAKRFGEPPRRRTQTNAELRIALTDLAQRMRNVEARNRERDKSP